MSGYDSELEGLVARLNSSTRSVRAEQPVNQDLSGLDQLLREAVRRNGSDLLIVAGAPAVIRVAGKLSRSDRPALSEEDTRNLLLPLLSPKQYQELQTGRAVDICFSREDIGRFRLNVHHQRGSLAGAIRVLPSRIPTLQSLHLPVALEALARARQGLVLITGATGSGKTSTLAALVGLINATRSDHVVTIEDPVEFVHSNRSSIVEHIEVGHDTPDFASAVRSILRQSPDVILVGEMRDPETIATALTASETGHLVLSTMHTNDASQTVSRILDSFPSSNQPQIRQQLSLSLLAIVAQQLVPAMDGTSRYPVVEIMMGTHAVRNLIRKAADHQLYTAISTGRADGMITMEQSLAEMVKSGTISRETAQAHCARLDELTRYLE